MKDPIIREYELGDFTDIYLETIKRIVPDSKIMGGLTGARYMPTTYALDIVDFAIKYPLLEDIRTAQMNVGFLLCVNFWLCVLKVQESRLRVLFKNL